MKISYTYNKNKDIWCLLKKGKSSNHSPQATETYEQLIKSYGDNPTKEEVSEFIDDFFIKNEIDPYKIADGYQKEWDLISDEFKNIAENIFNISLPDNIKAYLTINQRSPYSIENNFFYISLHNTSPRRVTMHELWHFYTWYGIGINQEEKLGSQKYNNLKESLTVLLNTECKNLLPEGVLDKGYPQHKETREKISKFWDKNKNIFDLWEFLIK